MALVINDRVKETSTTTGTGTLTLDGAVSGFETFSSAIGNTNTTYYAIVNGNGEFEVGLGTVGAGTLSRDTIISSSNSDAAVNFSAGTKDVFCTLPASKAVILDSSGNIVANNGSNLTNLNADNLASGTVPDARFPATLPAANGSALTDLNATNLASGTVPDARFPATLPAVSGANLTNLDADDLSSGTVPDARFPATLPAANGSALTNLDASNVASGTLSSDRLPTVPTTKGGTGLTSIGSANQVLAVNSGGTALEYQTPTTGDITGVTAGNGLTGGGTTGDVTLNVGAGNLIDVQADQIDVDLSELTTSTSDADGDFFAVIDSANAQKKLTKANINISGFNNDSGFIDGSSLNASNLDSGTVPDARFPATLPAISGANLTNLDASDLASGTVPIARIDLNLLTTSTADGDGDFFVVVDSVGAEKKLTKANINISGFNNDSGFTTNTGTVTSVSGGDGLTGSVTTSGSLAVGAGTLIDVTADAVNVDLSELATSTSDADGDFFAVIDSANAQKKLTKGNINISGFNNDAGYTTNTGDITGVTAGDGLTGGGTSGSVTLNVGAGNLIDVTADAIDVDLSELTTSTSDADGDFFVVVDAANAQKKLTKANIAISGFNNDSGFTTNTGTVTSVSGGNGLTGSITTSGSLAVGAGTGIDVTADEVAVDVSDFMTNGSNNRVLTATGTDAMNAETNLVYDGTQFGINLTSPTRALDVESSQILVAQFSSTNANFGRIRVPNGGSDYSYFGSFSSDARINGTSVVFEDGVNERMRVTSSGGATRVGIATASPGSTLDINGSLSKSSGSFKIDHPLESKKNTHHLVHSFVEAPQADNIYRGKINLVNGTATVNIDTVAGMSEGTFVLLNREIQCFTSNETGWTAVKGSVSGNILTITAQDNTCTDTISWMVIGERHDDHMYDTEWTDENGKVIVEPLK